MPENAVSGDRVPSSSAAASSDALPPPPPPPEGERPVSGYKRPVLDAASSCPACRGQKKAHTWDESCARLMGERTPHEVFREIYTGRESPVAESASASAPGPEPAELAPAG
eukprot:6327738-Alexandrium_andersonii.AAC.1